jgi:LacI family transcriptional regulator
LSKIKLSDIAATLKLSKATISKVLNSYPDVNSKTRERVLQYVKKVGFEPDRNASYLRTKETNTVALILPEMNHDFFNSVLAGVLKRAQQSKYNVFVGCSQGSVEEEKKLISQFLNQNVDAILVAVTQQTNEFKHLDEVQKEGKLLVMFDKIEKIIDCPKIIIDDRKAAFDATEHLILKGCKKILHFRGAYSPQISIDRYLGYRDALEKYDIPFDTSRVFVCENADGNEGYYNAKKVLDLGIEFDGLFAISDLTAAGAIKLFKEHNIKIPEELAVVGFSNWRFSQFYFPSITTIDQPGITMGVNVFEAFLNEKSLKKQGLEPENRTLKLPSKLIVRDTTAR